MKKILNTFIFLLVINLTAGYAQDITCKGIIVDAKTNLPLQGVRICSSDNINNILALSNENGEFQLPPLKVDSKLILKFNIGYVWYVLRVANNDPQQIKLVPSSKEFKINEKQATEQDLKMYFNGQLVPKEEWGDAAGAVDNTELVISDMTIVRNGLSVVRLQTK